MPLVEQELLILPEKMSSPKVLMGFILLDLEFPVSWERGQIPPFISVRFVDRYFSGQWNFEGASCSKILLALRGKLIFFLKSTPDVVPDIALYHFMFLVMFNLQFSIYKGSNGPKLSIFTRECLVYRPNFRS
jgi:hypothetical protein